MGLWELIRLRWDREWGDSTMGCLLIGRGRESSGLVLSLCHGNTVKRQLCASQEEGSHSGTKLASTLILDFPASKTKFLFLSQPIHGILLWQPKLTNTVSVPQLLRKPAAGAQSYVPHWALLCPRLQSFLNRRPRPELAATKMQFFCFILWNSQWPLQPPLKN